MSLKIGTINLKHGLLLAPMAGVTDRAFRHICIQCGAEYTVTEMVSAKALHFQDAESDKLARVFEKEPPCAVQIFGHEPEIMAEAASHLLTHVAVGCFRPSAIDINMGCPVRKIVSNGEGSALMRDPVLAGKIIRAVAEASDVPVTVKIRTGWSDDCKNAVQIAQIAEENGAQMVCVHGRTREQMYSPPVDYETIAAVKRAVSIPVVANGGIDTVSDAISVLEHTKCDGLMLARGTMGNPWLFSEIAASLEGRAYEPPPLPERLALAMEQVKEMIADKGERVGLLEARRHLAYYIKGTTGAAEVRHRLNLSSSLEEVESILYEYLRHTDC